MRDSFRQLGRMHNELTDQPKNTDAPLPERRRASVAVALVALCCLLAINAGGAAWRLWQLLTRVRADARVEFYYEFVFYPGLLAMLDALALIWLREGKPAGRALAILLFGYFALRIGWLAWTGGGPGIETPLGRIVAVGVQGGSAVAMLSLATWLFLRGTAST